MFINYIQMSLTSRINNTRSNTHRGSTDKAYQSFKTCINPIATYRPHSSIYEELATDQDNNKRNVLERFQEIRRKMTSSQNQRHKRITIQSITLDLLKQDDSNFNL